MKSFGNCTVLRMIPSIGYTLPISIDMTYYVIAPCPVNPSYFLYVALFVEVQFSTYLCIDIVLLFVFKQYIFIRDSSHFLFLLNYFSAHEIISILLFAFFSSLLMSYSVIYPRSVGDRDPVMFKNEHGLEDTTDITFFEEQRGRSKVFRSR